MLFDTGLGCVSFDVSLWISQIALEIMKHEERLIALVSYAWVSSVE
jgi:hypothetical protein